MMHLPPEGYCNATRIVFDPDAMMARAAEKVDYERGRTRTGQALLMNGVDHVEPHTAIPALIERLSAIPGQRARHSTLPDYVAAVSDAVETRAAGRSRRSPASCAAAPTTPTCCRACCRRASI